MLKVKTLVTTTQVGLVVALASPIQVAIGNAFQDAGVGLIEADEIEVGDSNLEPEPGICEILIEAWNGTTEIFDAERIDIQALQTELEPFLPPGHILKVKIFTTVSDPEGLEAR